MINFEDVGKEGVIFQYEDVVSMIGFNVIKNFRDNKVNDKAMRMSIEDILLSYVNRTIEDPSIWLKNEFDIDFNMKDYMESSKALTPNFLYSYKIFDTAYRNGIKKLHIHSQFKSDTIKKYLNTYQLPIEYSHGDIVPVLKRSVNMTYITSSTENIRRCMEVNVPFALTIVDDFMYVADIIKEKFDDKLRENNVYVCYTSIISGGLIGIK